MKRCLRNALCVLILLPVLGAGTPPPPRPDLWRHAVDLPDKEKIPLLQRVLREPLPSEEEGLIRIILGRYYKDAAKAEKALESLGHDTVGAAPLSEYGLLWRAEILEDLGRCEEAQPIWEALFHWQGEATFKTEAAERLLAEAEEKGDPAGAEEALDWLIRERPQDSELILLLTGILLGKGDTEGAGQRAMDLWSDFPATPAVLSFFGSHPELEPDIEHADPERVLRRLRSLVRQQAWWRLKRELPRFKPDGDRQVSWKHFLEGRVREADSAYGTSLRYYADCFDASTDASPEALAGIGRVMTRAGLPDKKRREWEDRVGSLDPQAYSEWEQILVSWMRMRMRQGQMNRALDLSAKILEKSPGQRNACELYYEEAWDAWMEGRKDTCERYLRIVANNSPEGNTFRQAALYSLLRLGFLAGEEAEAAREELARSSRFGYFGYRIRGGNPDWNHPTSLPVFPEDLVPKRSHWGKAELLLFLGLREEALKELRLALEGDPPMPVHWTKAKLEREMGDIPSSVRSARAAYPGAYGEFGGEVPEEIWKYFYPLEWVEDLDKAASAAGVPTEILCSIIRQESLWDPYARSSAGALGLMQLLPGTARAIARQIGLEGPVSVSLLSPAWNTRAGAAYFAGLLEDYDGRVECALAAYNAGPGRVNRWLARKNCPKDPDLFIESIPFYETRTYVRMVLLNYWEYRRIYGEFSDPIPEKCRLSLDPAGG